MALCSVILTTSGRIPQLRHRFGRDRDGTVSPGIAPHHRRPSAHAVSGRPRPAGIEVVDDPPFTHSFPHGHPTVRYDCEVRPTPCWRRGHDRPRRRAPARVVHRGAHPHRRPLRRGDARLLDDAVAWATERQQFGAAHLRLQGISFPLADSAADCAAARLLTYQVAELVDSAPTPSSSTAGGDGGAVRVRGRLALRRPLRAGARRPWVHAHLRRRAVPARAARRPHLGGHERDPAADHRPRPGEARRGAHARRRGAAASSRKAGTVPALWG